MRTLASRPESLQEEARSHNQLQPVVGAGLAQSERDLGCVSPFCLCNPRHDFLNAGAWELALAVNDHLRCVEGGELECRGTFLLPLAPLG